LSRIPRGITILHKKTFEKVIEAFWFRQCATQRTVERFALAAESYRDRFPLARTATKLYSWKHEAGKKYKLVPACPLETLETFSVPSSPR
jgi:hypothetical protein